MNTLFSRGGTTGANGKLDRDLKIHIDEMTETELLKRSSEIGMNKSEFARMSIMIALFGVDYVISLQQSKIKSVAGIGADGGTDHAH